MQAKKVTIEVMDLVGSGSNSSVTVTVTPDPVPLMQGTHDSIEWDLSTDGWSFTQDPLGSYNGVIIKNPEPYFKHDSSSKKKHKWKRITANQQPFQYTISVTRDSDPKWVVTWDPSIMNN